jgi:hypothetical protein
MKLLIKITQTESGLLMLFVRSYHVLIMAGNAPPKIQIDQISGSQIYMSDILAKSSYL